MHSTHENGPGPRRARLHPALPFVVPGGLGYLVVLAAAYPVADARLPALTLGLLAAGAAAAFLLPWHRLPGGAAALLPIGYLLDTFLLLEGTRAPFALVGPLVLLPLLWLALDGTRAQLWTAAALALGATVLHDARHGADAEAFAFQLLLGAVAAGLCVTAVDRRRRGSARATHFARMASTDPLTGVPNRRAWDGELVLALGRAAGAGSPLCVVLIDFDHFKLFNDSRGHPAGDELLREATARWRGILRGGDVLARYGGEEFAVLLPNCRLEVARAVGERLRAAVPLEQTCSVGIACWDGEETGGELVRRADAALYAAKAAGRDTTRGSQPGAPPAPPPRERETAPTSPRVSPSPSP